MIKKNEFYSICVFLINPVVGGVYSTFLYLKGGNGKLGLALSLALIFCYAPMMFDTSLNFYAIHYEQLASNFFSLYTFLPSIFKGEVDYYVFIYLYTVIIIFCWLSILHKINAPKLSFAFVVVLTMSLTYRDVMDLNRNSLAVSIAIYGIYCINPLGKFNSLGRALLAIISVYVHMSVILIWLVYYLSKFIRLNKSIAFSILCFSLFIGYLLPSLSSQLQNILSLLGSELSGRMEYYLYGDAFGVEVYTFTSMVRKLMSVFVIFIIGIVSLNNFDKDGSKESLIINKILFVLCCVTLFFEMYVTFFERLQLIVMYSYAVAFFMNRRMRWLKILILVLIMLRTIILYSYSYSGFFVGDYSVINNKTFLMETEVKPFIYPTIILFDFSNTYSDSNILKYNNWGK